MRFKYHPPVLIKKIFSSFIWETSNEKILLTFDDGPTDAATMKILNVLRTNNLKAIFFCVGNNIIKLPSLTEKILEDGHTIANHTMTHKSIIKMNREGTIQEISSFNTGLKVKFNYDVKYFRPPFGRFNLKTSRIMSEVNLKCVMWNLLTYDFQNNLDKVKYAVYNYIRKNSIIVFHDNIKSSDIIERALTHTVERATKLGYEFGEPEDCLK